MLFKNTNIADNWYIYDSTRDLDNPVHNKLFPNLPNKELTDTDNSFDFLSNGFKLRSNNGASNNSGNTIIYCCFAENPFGGENTAPANAR